LIHKGWKHEDQLGERVEMKEMCERDKMKSCFLRDRKRRFKHMEIEENLPKGCKMRGDGMVTSCFLRDGKTRSKHMLGGGANDDEGVPGGWVPEALLGFQKHK
jgi:hypothetical protein